MLILIIAGLYALIVGKLTITKNLRLSGKNARIYGVLLLVLCIPYALFATLLLTLIVPASILANAIVARVIDLGVILIIAISLAVPFREK